MLNAGFPLSFTLHLKPCFDHVWEHRGEKRHPKVYFTHIKSKENTFKIKSDTAHIHILYIYTKNKPEDEAIRNGMLLSAHTHKCPHEIVCARH